MSLETPTFIEKWWKPIAIGVGVLVLIGLILFISDQATSWYSGRQIDKIKANINVATQEIKDIQANVQREKLAEAAALERVKIETHAYLESVNASDNARTETNRAISNMESAINANRPVNITADELDRRLKELGY